LHSYEKALLAQPVSPVLATPLVRYTGAALFVVGQLLVVTSIWALGITGTSSYNEWLYTTAHSRLPRLAGTYLGDYFGILMSHRVTSFPFNILENPMYNGSTLCFLGTALWYARPAGVVITAVVFIVYEIALMYEG
jgi:phosphatidylethanolamine N-methyltransferase